MKYCILVPSSEPNNTLSYETNNQLSKDSDYGSNNFTSAGTLISPNNSYLVDGALTICCRIRIKFLDTPTHSSEVISKAPGQVHSLGSKMNDARLKGQFTDTVLVCGEREFKAHRAVLAMESSFFNTRSCRRKQDSNVGHHSSYIGKHAEVHVHWPV